MRLVTKCETNM